MPTTVASASPIPIPGNVKAGERQGATAQGGGRRWEDDMPAWRYRVCGDLRDVLPVTYGAAAPDPWYAVPENEREERAQEIAEKLVHGP